MTDDLKALKHEAQRKIGRNIMNFQGIEFMIKYLVSRSQFQGTIDTLKDNLQERDQDIHAKSLGLLAKDLFKTVYSERELDDPIIDSTEPWISFKFTSVVSDSALEKFKSELKNLIGRRNELIHHRLHSVRRDSPDSWSELIEFLDAQNEDIIPIFDWLRSTALSMIEMGKELETIMISDWT